VSADIALRQDDGPGQPSEDAAAALVRWAQAASAAHGLAQSLTRTSFVPQRYRGKPDEATAAILAGAELGLSPLAALRAFDDIQGTVAPKAVTLVAVAQSHGHHIEVAEESDDRAVVRYRRRGEPEWRTVSYSVADAQRAGLVTRNPNWRTQPRNMCVARAQSMAARRVASDAILGIAYSAEELADAAPAAVPSQRVTLDELDPTPAPAPEPPAAEPVGDQRPATRQQITKVILALNDLGIEDDDAQRAWLSQELRRDVTSRNTLTRGEASTVIQVLEVLTADMPGPAHDDPGPTP
jgi:hypothetical protein